MLTRASSAHKEHARSASPSVFFSKNLLSLNILDTGVLISESFKPSLDCVLGIRRKSVNGPDVQTGGFKAG